MTLAIKITKFFGKVNIYILLDELSKKTIPYYISQW
jgi:hypothetical protein